MKIFNEKTFVVGWIHATEIFNIVISLTKNFKDEGLYDVELDVSLNEGEALNFPGQHFEVAVIHMDSFVPPNEIQHGPWTFDSGK